MLLLDQDNRIIGKCNRTPPMARFSYCIDFDFERLGHPEAIQNADQCERVFFEIIEIFNVKHLRIIGETHPRVFEIKGIIQWSG